MTLVELKPVENGAMRSAAFILMRDGSGKARRWTAMIGVVGR